MYAMTIFYFAIRRRPPLSSHFFVMRRAAFILFLISPISASSFTYLFCLRLHAISLICRPNAPSRVVCFTDTGSRDTAPPRATAFIFRYRRPQHLYCSEPPRTVSIRVCLPPFALYTRARRPLGWHTPHHRPFFISPQPRRDGETPLFSLIVSHAFFLRRSYLFTPLSASAAEQVQIIYIIVFIIARHSYSSLCAAIAPAISPYCLSIEPRHMNAFSFCFRRLPVSY